MLKLEISNLKIQIFLETLVPFFKNEPVKTTFGKKKSFNFHKLHMFFKYHIFQKKNHACNFYKLLFHILQYKNSSRLERKFLEKSLGSSL